MQSITSRLFAALAYPRSPSDFLELVSPLDASVDGQIRARVVDIRAETHDVATWVLKTKRPFPHRAGQYVALTASIDGVRRTRCFSIASGEDSRTIEITIKAHPGGAVTPRLVAGTIDDRNVTISLPTGDFVLPEAVPDRVLLVSGGSGITPVMSMLRTLAAKSHQGEVVFLHWAREGADIIFGAELARIARSSFPNVRIHTRTSLFRAEDLAEILPDFESWETWACGPDKFMDAVRTAFTKRDSAHRVRTERFSLAAASTEASAAADVTFTRSQRRAQGGGPLLVMAEREGLDPKSGCRMGICHSCTCKKVSGTTRDLRTGALSSEADVEIQLCVSEAVGAVEIDL